MAMIAMMYLQPTWANDAHKNGEVCSTMIKYGWTRVLFFFGRGGGEGEMLQVKIRFRLKFFNPWHCFNNINPPANAETASIMNNVYCLSCWDNRACN